MKCVYTIKNISYVYLDIIKIVLYFTVMGISHVRIRESYVKIQNENVRKQTAEENIWT